MIWPLCVDLHTHLDKGHIWSRAQYQRHMAGCAGPRRQRSRDQLDRRGCRCAHGLCASLRIRSRHRSRAHAYRLDGTAKRDQLAGVGADAGSLGRPHRAARRFARDARSLSSVRKVSDSPISSLTTVASSAPSLSTIPIRLRHSIASSALARDRNLDLDFHADETDNPDSNGLEAIAEATIRFGWQGRVTAGHCCSLACRPDRRTRNAPLPALPRRASRWSRCRCATCICRIDTRPDVRRAGAA